MRSRSIFGVYILCSFCIFSLGIAFYFNRNFPILVVAGELSVGTWMSGVLLSCCVATALILAMHQGWYPWAIFTAFFFFLAADEHFMFHERMKEWIIFSYTKPPVIVRESPVVVGALIGAWVSWLLWNRLNGLSAAFLSGAVLLGTASVILDIVGSSALWEECFKLLAELAIACALLLHASSISVHNEKEL